ncbi:MAG: hypothetical protein KC492_30575, partial [Myxococcales bacterium]|nr:hypothetical protein [Myxococcales bacterium]
FFPELPQLDGDAAYVQAREASTHDLWHVVTGYDTTIPGEAAVLTFLAGQTPSTFTMMVAVGSSLLILCRSPRLLPVLARAYRSGRKAQQLSPLFWERMWELPLDDVRKRLGITPEEHPSVAYAK